MSKQYYKADQYEAKKSVGYLVRRGRNLVTSQLESIFKKEFGEDGLPYIQWVILMCLRDNLARTSSELSQYICHDSGALTRVLDQMEERGLIKRKRSSEDRRVVDLEMTTEGNKTIKAHVGVVVDFYNAMLADFSHEEVDSLIHLLTRFVNNLDSAKNGT